MDERSVNSRRYITLVIGGGVAGTTCAAELSTSSKCEGLNLEVVLLDPRPALKVSHVISQITKTAVDVGISEKDASLWCQEQEIKFIQDRASQLKKNYVICESGRCIKFDTCCIATGARPFLPKVLQNENYQHAILTLRDTDSVQRLQSQLKHARRAIIVGAGGIAMELVHEIKMCELVWVVKGSHIGGSFFDNRGARILAANMKSQKKRKRSPVAENEKITETSISSKIEPQMASHEMLGSGVGPNWLGRKDAATLVDKEGNIEEISTKKLSLTGGCTNSSTNISEVYDSEISSLENDNNNQWKVVAILNDGKKIGCDLVIVGTGVVPNVEWLANSNVQMYQASTGNSDDVYHAAGGVRVNRDSMETSIDGVFAAGDCTYIEAGEEESNWMQMRLWSQAITSGKIAAHGMLMRMNMGEIYYGLDLDIFSHATQFFGKKVVLLGRFNAQGLGNGYKLYERCDNESSNSQEVKQYIRVVVHENKVRGCVLIGDTECAEVFENLILGQFDVGWIGERLVDPDIDLADYFD